jgi:hypothetical protein
MAAMAAAAAWVETVEMLMQEMLSAEMPRLLESIAMVRLVLLIQ